MPVILTLGRRRHEDLLFNDSLGYLVRTHLKK
jgi:hypothetical protein